MSWTFMYSYGENSKLIEEVKKRPAIYDRHHADYNNKEVKEQIWTDICWEIFPKWSDLDDFERDRRYKDIQRKWRNLRDSFRKEVNFQKKVQSGSVRKKRQYVYYKNLKFLLPILLEQDTARKKAKQEQAEYMSSESMDGDKYEEEEEEEDDDETTEIIKFETEDMQLSNSSCSSHGEKDHQDEESHEEDAEHQTPVFELWDNTDNGCLGVSDYSLYKDVDEDRYFLLSLVPTFKSLSSKQKLSAKVQFLQVLQRLAPGSSNSSNQRSN